jgi:hypothetical protein
VFPSARKEADAPPPRSISHQEILGRAFINHPRCTCCTISERCPSELRHHHRLRRESEWGAARSGRSLQPERAMSCEWIAPGDRSQRVKRRRVRSAVSVHASTAAVIDLSPQGDRQQQSRRRSCDCIIHRLGRDDAVVIRELGPRGRPSTT